MNKIQVEVYTRISARTDLFLRISESKNALNPEIKHHRTDRITLNFLASLKSPTTTYNS